MSLINELEKVGLSEKEARVYLATLELAQSSVQDVAKKSGINRTTVYVILESLIKKGLCSTYSKDKKIYYMAESPDVLMNIFDLQKKAIEDKQKRIEELMPQLRSVFNRQESKPVVRFFEGKEGLRAMSNELLSSQAKIIRMIYSVDALKNVFSDTERDQSRKIRINKNIKSKVLYTFHTGELSSTPDGERIKIPEAEFPVNSDIALFDNKIRIASLGKKLNGVIIENEDMYNTFVSLFDLAWEAAKARAKK